MPGLLIFQTQVLLQLHVILLCKRKFFQELPGCLPGKAFLVRNITDQRLFLDFGLRVMQQNPQIILTGVIVGIHDIRQADTDLVDQILVLQGIGDHGHPLGQAALIQHHAIPGKDQRTELHLPLLHAVGKIFQDLIMAPGLVRVLKDLGDRKGHKDQIVLVYTINDFAFGIMDTGPDDRIHRVQISGHESRRHAEILRVSLQDLPGRLLAVLGELHVMVVIGNRQPLVLRPVFGNFQHAADGIPGFIKAQGPKACHDLHTVIRPCHFQCPLSVPDRLADARKELGGDPVHGIHTANAGPCGNGPFYSRKTQQIIILDGLKNGQKSFRPAAVRVLTDCLAYAFLQPGRQQEFCQQVMQFRIAGFDNAPDQGNRDQHRVIVAQQRFSGSVDHGGVTPVDPRGQDIIELDHMQLAGIGIAFDEIRRFGIHRAGIHSRCAACLSSCACLISWAWLGRLTCPACLREQVLNRRRAEDSQHLVSLQQAERVHQVGRRIRCPDRRTEKRPAVLERNILVQQIFIILPVPVRHKKIYKIPILLQHEFL